MAQRPRQTTKKKPLIWWAAHFILVVEHIKRKRTGPRYFVYENVYLVRARTGEEARRKGELLGRETVIEDDTLRWNGAPARFVFGGIRKVISCAEGIDRPSDRMGGSVRTIQDGDEATYSVFVVRDRTALRRLVRGLPVAVEYEE